MRWTEATTMTALAMAAVVAVGCVGDPADRRAYAGFLWACRHAPRCPTALACGDPCWQELAAGVLDELSACLLGPCEARGPCVSEAVAVCPTDGAVTPGAVPAASTFTAPARSPDDGD